MMSNAVRQYFLDNSTDKTQRLAILVKYLDYHHRSTVLSLDDMVKLIDACRAVYRNNNFTRVATSEVGANNVGNRRRWADNLRSLGIPVLLKNQDIYLPRDRIVEALMTLPPELDYEKVLYTGLVKYIKARDQGHVQVELRNRIAEAIIGLNECDDQAVLIMDVLLSRLYSGVKEPFYYVYRDTYPDTLPKLLIGLKRLKAVYQLHEARQILEVNLAETMVRLNKHLDSYR